MNLRILHLSDLHSCEAELPYLRQISAALLEDLRIFKSAGMGPDLVCVTGDLINKGENANREFTLATELFLQPLEKLLGLAKDDIAIVPGNHEINRTQVSKAFDAGFAQTVDSQEA